MFIFDSSVRKYSKEYAVAVSQKIARQTVQESYRINPFDLCTWQLFHTLGAEVWIVFWLVGILGTLGRHGDLGRFAKIPGMWAI